MSSKSCPDFTFFAATELKKKILNINSFCFIYFLLYSVWQTDQNKFLRNKDKAGRCSLNITAQKQLKHLLLSNNWNRRTFQTALTIPVNILEQTVSEWHHLSGWVSSWGSTTAVRLCDSPDRSSASVISVLQLLHWGGKFGVGPHDHNVMSHPGQLYCGGTQDIGVR